MSHLISWVTAFIVLSQVDPQALSAALPNWLVIPMVEVSAKTPPIALITFSFSHLIVNLSAGTHAVTRACAAVPTFAPKDAPAFAPAIAPAGPPAIKPPTPPIIPPAIVPIIGACFRITLTTGLTITLKTFLIPLKILLQNLNCLTTSILLVRFVAWVPFVSSKLLV